MLQNKAMILVPLSVFLIFSCMKRYDPEIGDKDIQKYIVSGQVNQGDSIQYVTIGRTAPLTDPWHKYNYPVPYCYVEIIDDKGNRYQAFDNLNGTYSCCVPQSSINTGSSFKLNIFTPDEENIVSDFDIVNECPEVDSLYYKLEQIPGPNQRVNVKGIRFYVDLDAAGFTCRNFRWEATETWKYKAIFAIGNNYGTCYKTDPIRNIYTLSTRHFTENKYMNYRMHFVDNYSSQRLVYCYSLLLRQFSLSDEAYEYWEKIRVNSTEQGGLYEKQPLPIKGNLHNLSDPGQPVLGFFGASSVKEKRIFVINVPGLPIEYVPCDPEPKPEPECIDCRKAGGTIIKPSFWPN